MLVDETSGRIKKDALAGSIYADEKWPENDVLGIGQERLQTEGVKSLYEHLGKQAPDAPPADELARVLEVKICHSGSPQGCMQTVRSGGGGQEE